MARRMISSFVRNDMEGLMLFRSIMLFHFSLFIDNNVLFHGAEYFGQEVDVLLDA